MGKRYALLCYQTHASFADNGHIAYWDGWYDNRQLCEEVAQLKMQDGITVVIVEFVAEVTERPVQRRRSLPAELN